MDRNQADTAAAAVLEPHLQEQQQRAHRAREKEARARAHKRRGRIAVGFLLAGAAVGVGTAYVVGSRPGSGLLWGVIIGSLVGCAVAWRREPANVE